MQGIAIYGNPKQNEYIPKISSFLKQLSDRGIPLYVAEHFAHYLRRGNVDVAWTSCASFPLGEVERVVSIGGDGTFLRAAQWVGDSGVPILGINTGHLGFLASYSFMETDELIGELLEEAGHVEPRMLLRVESPYMPEDMWPYALNEVAVMKSDTASMLNVRAWVDDNYLADYLADGLIVATPTGSTAYNLSVGGPILDPTVSDMVLSPIAPHSLTMRPLVIGGESRVEAAVLSKARHCRISIDGRAFSVKCTPQGQQADPVVRITRAPFAVNILRRPGSHFSEIMRHKLLWGRGTVTY